MHFTFLTIIIIILVIILIYQYYNGMIIYEEYINDRDIIQWARDEGDDIRFRKKLNLAVKRMKFNEYDREIKDDVIENVVKGFLMGGVFGGVPGAIGSCFLYGTMTGLTGDYKKIRLKRSLEDDYLYNY